MIWQRLDSKLQERLRLFARDYELSLLDHFTASLTDIKAKLEAMPLAIITSDLPPDALWLDRQGELWASQWGYWALEPVGASWPVSEKILPLLPAAFEEAQLLRTDLKAMTIWHAELAALVFAFDKACQRQAYRTAIELIEPILSAHDSIGGQTSKG